MEHTLKKKTKQLIVLKTNNFIELQIEKENFFKHLLQTLERQLDQKQFQFLTNYLLFHQKNTQKRIKHQPKNPTQKRILTQPDQRAFNLSQIDPDLFHDKPTKQDNFIIKKSPLKTQEIDFNCTNTPKRNTKHIVFENKRIMDLDKKLMAKFENTKNFIVYNPKILSSEKQNMTRQKFYIKTAYQNSLKRTGTKGITRLKTSFTHSRQEKTNKKEHLFHFENTFLNGSLRNGEMNEGYPSDRFRKSQNSIPKHLLEQVVLSRRHWKLDRSCNDFSDFKLSSRYKDCFS